MKTIINLQTLAAIVCLLVSFVSAQDNESQIYPAGYLYSPATENSERVSLPLQSTYVVMGITPGLSETTLVQEFTNHTDSPLEAIYLFPIPTDATITNMELHIGDRIIASKVQRKSVAKATYEAAKSEGKKTALIEHHRTNVFSTAVANFQPGETVAVHLSYVEDIEYEINKYSIHFPLVTREHYVEENPTTVTADSVKADCIELEDFYENDHQIVLDVLISGIPVDYVKSSTHEIHTEYSDSEWHVSLGNMSAQPDKDFNLEIIVDINESTQPTIISTSSDTGNYGLLTLFPPKTISVDDSQVEARDIVFLVDHSSSMGDLRMKNTRKGILSCLNKLNPEDRFNIVKFDDDYEAYSEMFVQASRANLESAKSFIRKIKSQGGTVMQPALEACLKMFDSQSERSKVIVFLTDGDVGNERSLIKLLENQIGDIRLFTFGISLAPNQFLIKEMARAGRGQARFIYNDENISDEITKLFLSLNSPVLTDISLQCFDKNNQKIELDYFPNPIPDLFVNSPVQVVFRSEEQVPSNIVMTAIQSSKKTTQNYRINNGDDKHSGMEFLFGQKMMNTLQSEFYQTDKDIEQTTLIEEMTEVALLFQLVSPYTSRVAVDQVRIEKKANSAPPPSTPTITPSTPVFSGSISTTVIGIDGDVFELSPFTVSSSSGGYRATSTLSGCRVKTNLKDLGAAISVVTSEFLEDIGATDASDALDYTSPSTGLIAHANFAIGSSDTNSLINLRSIEQIRIPLTPTTILYNASNPSQSKNILQSKPFNDTTTEIGASLGNHKYSHAWLDHNQSFSTERTNAIRVIGSWQEENKRHSALDLQSRHDLLDGTSIALQLNTQDINEFVKYDRISAQLEQRINDNLHLLYVFNETEFDPTQDSRFLIGDTNQNYYKFPAADQLYHIANYDRRIDSSHSIEGSIKTNFHNVYLLAQKTDTDESVLQIQNSAKTIYNNYNKTNLAFAYQLQLLNESLHLILGQKSSKINGDRFDNSITDESQNIGLVLHINDSISLKSSYASSEKTSTLYQQPYLDSYNRFVSPSDTQAPEQYGKGIDIGISFDLWDGRYSGSFTYFHANNWNQLYRDWDAESKLNEFYQDNQYDFTAPIVYSNFDKAYEEGLSLNIVGNPLENFSFVFNAYTDWSEKSPIKGGKTKGSLFGRYNFFQGSLNGLFVGGGFRYQDELIYNDGYVLPETFLLDFLVGYEFKTFEAFKPELRLNLRNLNGDDYQRDRFDSPSQEEIVLSLKIKF